LFHPARQIKEAVLSRGLREEALFKVDTDEIHPESILLVQPVMFDEFNEEISVVSAVVTVLPWTV
jgi:hypothetical protein